VGGGAKNVTIRKAGLQDAPRIASVHVEAWRETYGGLIPDAVIDRQTVTRRTQQWEGFLAECETPAGPAIFVAERAGELHGFVSCAPQRDVALRQEGFTGEVTGLYVLRRAQRQGLGRALMTAAGQALLDRGHRAASLWALRDNGPAVAFYARLGGVVTRERKVPFDDAMLTEWAFGWRDFQADVTGNGGSNA
jgi:ribosomal protein S18 acetylase RimI-like enzyme